MIGHQAEPLLRRVEDVTRAAAHAERDVRFVDERGATIEVENGSVAASFLPREKAAWAVEAGPYALRAASARQI